MTSKSMPTVSAIIPTHNRSQTVLRALRSVYAQRIPVNEVIVIDDGSSDDTAARVQACLLYTSDAADE